MERVDSRKTWVDDPIWRSEEFIRERLEFLDQNFPVLFQPYWGQPVDLEYRRRLEIAADCILELKYSDGRAVIPLIGILRAASKEQLIVLDEDRDTSDLGPSPGILERDNWEFYKLTVEALGAIGDERAVEPIIESIVTMGYDPHYTREAFLALAAIGTERAIGHIFDAIGAMEDLAFDRHDHYENESVIREALTGVPLDRRCVNLAISILERHENRLTRELAADALGSSYDPRALQPLVGAVRNEREREVRHAALKALERLQRDLTHSSCAFTHGLEEVITALRDPELYVSIAAAEMLGNYRSEKAVQPLIDCFEDLGIDVCLRSLAYIGGEVATSYLIGKLGMADERHRLLAADALWCSEEEEVLVALLESISERTHNFGSRKMVWEVIKSIQYMAGWSDESQLHEKAEGALIRLLEKQDPMVRSFAVTAIGRNLIEGSCFHRDSCTEALRRASKDADRNVRHIAKWYCSNATDIVRDPT